MIAPLKQPPAPSRPRRTPLHAARLAVAEALLDDKSTKSVRSRILDRRKIWLLAAGVVLVAGLVLWMLP